MLTRRMKMHLLEQQGKLFYNVANDYTGFAEFEKESIDDSVQSEQVLSDEVFERTFMKGHKQAITSLEWMHDNKSVITGAKDCCLIRCKSIPHSLCRGPGISKKAVFQR
jgi:hypothetical protein